MSNTIEFNLSEEDLNRIRQIVREEIFAQINKFGREQREQAHFYIVIYLKP